MATNYQIETLFTFKGKQFYLFADRIAFDQQTVDIRNDEFIFAQSQGLAFSGKKQIAKAKYPRVGFWYWLFASNIIHDGCYFIVDTHQDGQFIHLDFAKRIIETGAVIGGKTVKPLPNNLNVITLECNNFSQKLKKPLKVLTPKQQKIKALNKRKQSVIACGLALVASIILGEYLINLQLNRENQLSAELSHLSFKVNRVNEQLRQLNDPVKNYAQAHYPYLKLLAEQAIWSGSLDLYQKEAVFTTDYDIAHRLMPSNNIAQKPSLNIIQTDLNKWQVKWGLE